MLVPIMTASQQPIRRKLLPPQVSPTLKVASLNWQTALDNLGSDYSVKANHGTVYGKPSTLPRAGVILDGTDDRIDFGDVGNIQQIGMWIRPASATEQIVLVDTGPAAYIHLVGGTVTYVNLTPIATYVNAVASTTLVAGEWQLLVCQFTQVDANNFELGWDGTSYGEIDVMDFTAEDGLSTLAMVRLAYQAGVPDDSLLLHAFDGTRDLSKYERTLTRYGGVVVGHDMEFAAAQARIDCGDLGNIQTIMGWVKPASTTEELWLIDTTKDIMIFSGTVTYTNLTPVVTYVNGAPGTTMVADRWQHLACVIETEDANNFELGWDRMNYGNSKQRHVEVFSSAKTAQFVKTREAAERKFF